MLSDLGHKYHQISREWHVWPGLAPFPDNPFPEFGKGFDVIRTKPATTCIDAQLSHTNDIADRIYARMIDEFPRPPTLTSTDTYQISIQSSKSFSVSISKS